MGGRGMPKANRDLYEKCWGCDGTRKLVRAAHIDETRTKARNAQPGEECPLCEDGYMITGLTAGQVERLVEKARLVPEMLAVLAKFAAGHHYADEELSRGRSPAEVDLLQLNYHDRPGRGPTVGDCRAAALLIAKLKGAT